MHIVSYTYNMHKYIPRYLEKEIERRLAAMPVVAILGPRQCGKTTLAKAIESRRKNTLHLDLERPSDLNRLRDPEAFFRINSEKLICLDEIQRKPNLFPLIRSIVDEQAKKGMFLILGSASPELLRQSSESLAGRIAYLELTPFSLEEVCGPAKGITRDTLWMRGGFPSSLLANNDRESIEWREDFIMTFLERDIPSLGFQTSSDQLHRFWIMASHASGSVLNLSRLGSSLGVSHNTIRSYITMMNRTFLLRELPPFSINLKKRLVKSPKLYVRDSGLFHALLKIETMNDLFGHPYYGPSWEGFVVEQIAAAVPRVQAFFYRDSNGNEIDLVLESGKNLIAVECKASTAPVAEKGFFSSCKELGITHAWIAAPVKDTYPIEKNIFVGPPEEIIHAIKSMV